MGTGSIYEILKKLEELVGIKKEERPMGSRTTRHHAASAMLRAGIPMPDISAALRHRDPNIVSVLMPEVCPLVHSRSRLSGKKVFPMRTKSLSEMINQFVSYKKANGCQYQTGTYYLKNYARFARETAPETVAPDKASVEGFLEKLRDAPRSFYNAAAFLRKFSRYLTARLQIILCL